MKLPSMVRNALKKAISIDPSNKKLYEKIGEIYYFQKMYIKAISSFQKVIEIDPQNENVLEKLGRIYYKIGNTEKSIKSFKKIVEINPQRNDIQTIICKIKEGKKLF